MPSITNEVRSKGRNESSSRRGQEKRRPARVKSSHIITEHIDVGVPAETAFDQWTQYDKWSEMFKRESASKKKGRSSDGDINVRAKIGPSGRTWQTEIVGVEPGRRLTWRAKGGLQAKGATSFHPIDERLTRLMVEIEYKPSGMLETIGNFFRMQRRRVRRDLRLFKNYIELRGDATGKGPRRAFGDRDPDGGSPDSSQNGS